MARNLGTLTLDLVLNLAGFKQGMDRAARETQRGAQRIQSQIAGLQRGFATAGRALAGFGVGFSVAAVTNALVDATKEAIEFGDEIEKAMARTGIGAETLTELAFAAEQSEVELATLTTGLRNMQVVISDAAAGNKAAIQTLKDLGLTAKELQDLAPEDQFELIAQRLSEFGDEADRAALRQDIFKRSGEALAPVLEKGARGIRDLRDAAHEFGATLTDEQARALAETDKALDELSSAYAGLKRQMSAAIAPELTDFFTGLTDAITGNADEVLTLGDRWDAFVAGMRSGNLFTGGITALQELGKAAKLAREELSAIEITATPIGTRTRTDPAAAKAGEDAAKKAAAAAEKARKSILDLITAFEQQTAVTGETEEATIRYRIAFGDLVDEFDKAGPKFEERKQQLIDAAAAADQFKAGEELRKANEQIAEQVIELQAQRIALTDGAAAAFEYRAQHGELAETLDLATDSQNELTDAILEGANAAANLEREQAITALDQLVRSTEDATSAIIANKIAEEQGAVAAIRYRIAQGDLKDEFEKLGTAAGEWQAQLEAAVRKQEELTQAQAEIDASESIIPSRTKALKEYDDAIAGLTRRLQEGEISQRDFDQAVKIAEKNFKEATKAIDELSVFAEEAARNMQDAFADFLFDPFEDGLEGMVNGFADTLRRMAAEVVAAKLAELFNFEDIFKSGGIFGGGGGGFVSEEMGRRVGATLGGVLSPVEITAQRIPLPGAAETVGDVAGESAAAAAFTAAGTAAAAALTTAGTTAAAAFTASGTAAATALTTSGATVASSIIAAGTTAAAAIGAAATAGSAAGGLSEIVISATRLAEGGKVFGPGTPTSDSIPAWLSAGEFVVKASAVKQPGIQDLLERINTGGVFRGYAAGGHVYAPNYSRQIEQHFAAGGLVQAVATPTANPAPTIIQQTFNLPNVTNVSRGTEMQLTAAAARGARLADRRNN